MSGITDDPRKLMDVYLKERHILPEISMHRYLIYEVVFAELIKDHNLMRQEVKILKDRVYRLESR